MSWFYSAATITVGMAVLLRLLWWACSRVRQSGRPALAMAPHRAGYSRRQSVLKEMARRGPRSGRTLAAHTDDAYRTAALRAVCQQAGRRRPR